jgi:catechol 2,3-dioxygenase-like lactoylglutathione lyase family enzyme
MTATTGAPDLVTCGCCGRELPVNRVAELGVTPGTYICAVCARWAGSRAGGWWSAARVGVPRLIRRVRGAGRLPATAARTAIPVLASTDLDRTAAFYAAAGFQESGRHDGYLLLSSGDAELHVETQPGRAPGACFVHVGDAMKLWKVLRERGVAGVGQIADQDYGLREFVLTDPDGNEVRFGSPR